MHRAIKTTLVAATAAATVGLGWSASSADAATPRCSGFQNAGLGIWINACISKTGDGLVSTTGSVVDFRSNTLERGCTVVSELNRVPNDVKWDKQTCLLQAELHRTEHLNVFQRGCQGGQTYVTQIKVRFTQLGTGNDGQSITSVIKSPSLTC